MTPYHFYYVYILKSIKRVNATYIGYTRDLRKRLMEHNNGNNFSTKRYAPWRLIYYEAFSSEKLARKRESNLKYNGNSMRELKKRMFDSKSDKGFTLIETVIYIALFTMLITSGFVAVYELIEGTDSLNKKVRTEEEGNFVMRKMAWSLSAMDPNISPVISGNGCSQTLTITKTNSVNSVIFRLRNLSGKNYIEVQDDGVNFYPITTENASTSCLRFSSTGTSPIGITATSTINGTNFVITKYVRK